MTLFCQECGSKLEENQPFCQECGTPVQEQNVQQAVPVQKTQPQPVQQIPKQPMNFKKKLSIALIGLLAIGLGAGHYVIQAKTSPQDRIDTLIAALINGDESAVMEKIEVPENVEKNETSYVDFLKFQDPEDLRSRLYEAASGVKSDGITRTVTHENGTELFRISRNKFIGLYPVIDIEAIPVSVALQTDLKSGKYDLNGKAFDLSKEPDSLGSYLPGVYVSSFSIDNGEVVRKVEAEQTFMAGQDIVIELDSKDYISEIWSNKEEAVVFLNDESTGKAIKELKSIGPLGAEEEVEVHVEFKDEKGEMQKSEVVTAKAGDFVELPIISSGTESAAASKNDEKEEKAEDVAEEKEKEEKEQPAEEENLLANETEVGNFVVKFRAAYEDALNAKEFAFVDEYLQEDGVARSELVEFIGDLGNEYFLYEFTTDNVIGYNFVEGKAFVTTYEEFDFTNHLYETINYKRTKEYEIVLEDSGYKITKITILNTDKDG